MKLKWKYSDLEFLIHEEKRNLSNPNERFNIRSTPPRMAISNTVSTPSYVEKLYSDRDILCGNEQIEADYKEEISQIEHLM